jgi:hypothetical protein
MKVSPDIQREVYKYLRYTGNKVDVYASLVTATLEEHANDETNFVNHTMEF